MHMTTWYESLLMAIEVAAQHRYVSSISMHRAAQHNLA